MLRCSRLDITLEETRNAIANRASELDTIDWSNPFAAAVVDDPSFGYSGLAGMFARARAQSERPLSARVYFEDYISDLSSIVLAVRNSWLVSKASSLIAVSMLPKVNDAAGERSDWDFQRVG